MLTFTSKCDVPRRTRPGLPIALLFAGGLLGISTLGLGQAGGINQGGPGYMHENPTLDPMPKHGSSDEASKLEQMRQAERRRHLEADAARLLELSTQVKAQIDQAPKDQLSLDTMRKASEIEKLAQDVKKWLKS